MDSFFNSTVIWFIIGFVFFLLEFAMPGFILFFFGVGAWVVAVVSLFADISLTAQLFIFLASSLITVVLFRGWVKAKLGMMKAEKPVLEDEIIGKKATAETAFLPGHYGKVLFKGASWKATSDKPVNPGDEVVITGYESIILTVKPIHLS